MGATLASALVPLLPALEEGEELVPFLDPQPANPERPMVQWDQLTSWITPVESFFTVAHYGYPKTSADGWALDIGGLVERPRSYALEEIRRRPRREFPATLECSGNGSAAGFLGGIGNGRWTGTPLAPILKECGVREEAIEAVFFGADQGAEKIRGRDYPQHFGRSLALPDALKNMVLLSYELNGQPIDNRHGGPLRLVVPGWYGVAWVKWLNRIELHDRRFMARFMGRDYVTIRGEERGDQVIWREMAVGRMNLKSIVARVTRRPGSSGLRVTGAAWNDGPPLRAVELKMDSGPWLAARIGEGATAPYCWKFWSFDWKDPAPGEHTLVSRAIDRQGRIQPAAEDAAIKLKRTYWEANQQYPRRVKV